jgi:hypothetical protein
MAADVSRSLAPRAVDGGRCLPESSGRLSGTRPLLCRIAQHLPAPDATFEGIDAAVSSFQHHLRRTDAQLFSRSSSIDDDVEILRKLKQALCLPPDGDQYRSRQSHPLELVGSPDIDEEGRPGVQQPPSVFLTDQQRLPSRVALRQLQPPRVGSAIGRFACHLPAKLEQCICHSASAPQRFGLSVLHGERVIGVDRRAGGCGAAGWRDWHIHTPGAAWSWCGCSSPRRSRW